MVVAEGKYVDSISYLLGDRESGSKLSGQTPAEKCSLPNSKREFITEEFLPEVV